MILLGSRTSIGFLIGDYFVFFVVFAVLWMFLILLNLYSSLVIVGNLKEWTEYEKKYVDWL